jgi:glycine cleavage system H protein
LTIEEIHMSEVRFSDQHEWVRVDGDEATIGITKFAAEKLGDVVFVELPEAGRKVGAGGEIAVVESVKAASDVYSPVSGEVTANNVGLVADPAKVNEDPEGASWFFKLKLADKGELAKLMTADQYAEFVKGQ